VIKANFFIRRVPPGSIQQTALSNQPIRDQDGLAEC
jgi:hypothetical protein